MLFTIAECSLDYSAFLVFWAFHASALILLQIHYHIKLY